MKKLVLAILFLVALPAHAQVYVSGNYYVSSVTPTVTAASTNYTAGDAIGGMLTFSGVPDEGMVQGVILADEGKEEKNAELCLFSALANTTITNNSAVQIADADLANLFGCVTINSFTAYSDNGVGLEVPLIPYHITPNASTLYGVLIDRAGTYLFDATDAVTVTLIISRNP